MTWVRVLVALASASLGACAGSPRMEREAPDVNLTGTWRLDKNRSDDVRARLAKYFAKQDKQWHRIEEHIEQQDPGVTAGPPEGAGADFSTAGWLRRQRHREADALVAFISGATQLEITQSAQSVRIASNKGEGTRTFVPGEQSTLFNAMGGFIVNSGWDKQAFVVESRGSGENKLSVIERFLRTSSDTLDYSVDIRIPDIGREQFHFAYTAAAP